MKIVHVTGKWGDVRARRMARMQLKDKHEVVLVMDTKTLDDDRVLVPARKHARNFGAPKPEPLDVILREVLEAAKGEPWTAEQSDSWIRRARASIGDDIENVTECDDRVDDIPTFVLNKRFSHKLRDQVAALKPDLVVAHELDSFFLLVSLWTEAVNEHLLDGEPVHHAGFGFAPTPFPLIYDTHEYERGRPYIWKNVQTDIARAWQERESIFFADAVTTPSNAIAARLHADYALRDYPTVIWNSPFAPTRPVDRDRAIIRERLGIKPNEKAIGFAGYITPDRMLRQLAHAFTMLGQGWRLFIMGRTTASELEQELAAHGAEFLGELPYPWPELQDGHTLFDGLAAMDVAFSGSDIRAYPNWRMGAPNKFFEYAIAGVPQVISDALDPAAWVEKFKIGVVYDQSVRGLVRAIQEASTMTVDRDAMAREFAYDLTQGQRLANAYDVARARHETRSRPNADAA